MPLACGSSRQVRGAVELAAADVILAGRRLAERHGAGIDSVDEAAEREEVEPSRTRDA
jgi:hypothetical protein